MAALDVFETEPLDDPTDPLPSMDKVWTPHIGYVTREEWDVQSHAVRGLFPRQSPFTALRNGQKSQAGHNWSATARQRRTLGTMTGEANAHAYCGACGAELPQDHDPADPCDCGSVRRDLGVTPITAVAHVEAHVRGTIKSDERLLSGGRRRRALERWFGDTFHRDSGTWRRLTQTVDRKNDRYRKQIMASDGKVVLDVDEPLSEHRGHGAARRS